MIWTRATNERPGGRRVAVWLRALLPTVLLLATACAGSAPPAAPPAQAPTASVAATAGASTPQASGVSSPAATLRLFYWQAPTTMNPHLSPGTKDYSASRITYEPLASFDKQGNLVPYLAAEIPSRDNGGVATDGRSVTWKLKHDVKWSDGQPFTADDVVFTYQYIVNKAVGATSSSAYAAVEQVQALDSHTVKVQFKAVNPAWTLPFVGVQGMIIPRHIFESYNGPNAKDAPANLRPVGTGPFRVVEFKNEDILIIGGDAVTTIKIVYERNPLFRDADKVFFSRVELQGGGGDALLAARATRDGLADYAWNLAVGSDALDQLEAGGKARAIISFGAFTERIMLNFTDPNRETADGERASTQFSHPFLTDSRVRQAIALAVDREAIAKLWGRGGRATNNLLVSPPSYASPNTTSEFSLQKAAALLDQAGWRDSNGDGVRDKGGQKLSITYQTSINPTRQQTQEIVKKALESIGFQVDLKKIDSSIFLGPVGDNTNTRRHFYADLEQYAFSNKSPDPGAYMAAFTCAEVAQKVNQWSLGNWGRYCNPEYDTLYQKSTTEMDPARRQQLFVQMNDLLVNDVALIPLVHQAEVSGVSLSLQGLDITPWDVEVWNIKDWRRG